MPELSDAHRLLDEQAKRREDLFQQSVAAERTRGDALSKRFEEALRQAKTSRSRNRRETLIWIRRRR